MPGDTICFTVALHALDDDDQHLNCCNFHDCIVLPDCPVGISCACEGFAASILDKGISYTASASTNYTGVFTVRRALPCDVVNWFWTDTPNVDQTIGNQTITHKFPGPGIYTACAYVFRTDDNGQQCSVETCRDVKFVPSHVVSSVEIFPNPSPGNFRVESQAPWMGAVHFRLHDLQSRLVKQWDARNVIGETQIPVELDWLEKGVYLLEIESEGERWIRKVVFF